MLKVLNINVIELVSHDLFVDGIGAPIDEFLDAIPQQIPSGDVRIIYHRKGGQYSSEGPCF